MKDPERREEFLPMHEDGSVRGRCDLTRDWTREIEDIDAMEPWHNKASVSDCLEKINI